MKGFFLYLWLGGALLYTANTLFLSHVVQPDGQGADKGAASLQGDPLKKRGGSSSSWGPYLPGHTPGPGNTSVAAASSPPRSHNYFSTAHQKIAAEQHVSSPLVRTPSQPAASSPVSTARNQAAAEQQAPPLPLRTPTRSTVAATSFPPVSNNKTSTAQNQVAAETNSDLLPSTNSPAQTDKAQDAPSDRPRSATQHTDEPTSTARQQVTSRLRKTRTTPAKSRQVADLVTNVAPRKKLGRVDSDGLHGRGLFMFAPPGF